MYDNVTPDKRRTTIYISQELQDQVQNIADAKKWSLSKAISVLLESAIKEKQRKSKKSHSNT